MTANILGCDAPKRVIQHAILVGRPLGVVISLACGHQRFLGGECPYTVSQMLDMSAPCLSCVPLQNDMGDNPSW